MTVTSQLWPPDPSTLQLPRQVWDVATARTLPGVGRALSLYGGLIAQMPLDDYRGIQPQPRPRLLEQPDLELARSTYVTVAVEEYLLHGNTASLVTARDAEGWPAAVRWFPVHQWTIGKRKDDRREYRLNQKLVDPEDVVHVQRGADPNAPHRGVGVVEQHVRSLNRAGLQEEYERQGLSGGGVPSVAVIAPQRDMTENEADTAADKWESKFSGGVRRPAILPNGTQVVPLSWNPHDQEMTEARKLTLTDLANIFNLDPYWLGAPGSSHTYRSPGPMYLTLLRTSLNPVMTPFEDTWSMKWLPRGRRVTFDRKAILADDLPTTIRTMRDAVDGGLWTLNQALAYMGMPPVEGGDELRDPTPAPPPAPEPEPEPEPEGEPS